MNSNTNKKTKKEKLVSVSRRVKPEKKQNQIKK